MLTTSIIIPVKPGLTPKAAHRISILDWPPDRFELLIAEGTNPGRQRNQAAQQAVGQILYFLDDDSLVSPDALQRLEQRFSDARVTAVGGPSLTPDSDTLLQRAFGAVLSSWLGAGGVRNRYCSIGSVRETTERELILCNLAIRRDVFLAAGGLDERLYPNEENELLDRLQKQGGRLLHDPQLAVYRSQRESLSAFVRQMFRYGRGRAEQTRLAGFNGLMPFVPLGFLAYLSILLAVQKLFLFLPLAVYLASAVVCSIRTALQMRTPSLLLLLPFLFPLLHIANGLGLLVGFLLPLKDQTCYKQPPVTVRRVMP